MEGQQKPKLFREKSLKAIESPEALNDYLRVTSPRVWLVLAAVIVLLTGVIIWSIFGRIDTTMQVAVVSNEEHALCYIPYDALEQSVLSGSVTVNGESYPLLTGEDTRVFVVSDETDPFIRVAGTLESGDVAVEIAVDGTPGVGVFSGTIVTDRLQPITLLLQ